MMKSLSISILGAVAVLSMLGSVEARSFHTARVHGWSWHRTFDKCHWYARLPSMAGSMLLIGHDENVNAAYEPIRAVGHFRPRGRHQPYLRSYVVNVAGFEIEYGFYWHRSDDLMVNGVTIKLEDLCPGRCDRTVWQISDLHPDLADAVPDENWKEFKLRIFNRSFYRGGYRINRYFLLWYGREVATVEGHQHPSHWHRYTHFWMNTWGLHFRLPKAAGNAVFSHHQSLRGLVGSAHDGVITNDLTSPSYDGVSCECGRTRSHDILRPFTEQYRINTTLQDPLRLVKDMYANLIDRSFGVAIFRKRAHVNVALGYFATRLFTGGNIPDTCGGMGPEDEFGDVVTYDRIDRSCRGNLTRAHIWHRHSHNTVRWLKWYRTNHLIPKIDSYNATEYPGLDEYKVKSEATINETEEVHESSGRTISILEARCTIGLMARCCSIASQFPDQLDDYRRLCDGGLGTLCNGLGEHIYYDGRVGHQESVLTDYGNSESYEEVLAAANASCAIAGRHPAFANVQPPADNRGRVFRSLAADDDDSDLEPVDGSISNSSRVEFDSFGHLAEIRGECAASMPAPGWVTLDEIQDATRKCISEWDDVDQLSALGFGDELKDLAREREEDHEREQERLKKVLWFAVASGAAVLALCGVMALLVTGYRMHRVRRMHSMQVALITGNGAGIANTSDDTAF